MRFNFSRGSWGLALALSLLVSACGSGSGDSKKLEQIVDADRQGIVSIALADNDGYVHLRGSKQLVLQGTDKNNQIVDLSSKASWRLSDTRLGKIDSKGLFTPSGESGQLTVTASYADLSTSQPLIIFDADLVSITLISETSSVDVCKNASFSAEALFDNGLVLDYPLEWRLANSQSEELASFPNKNQGLLKTHKSGVVSILAEGKNNAGETVSSSPLEFSIAPTLTQISLSAPEAENLSLREGQTTQLQATAKWVNGTSGDIITNASLSLSDNKIARIDSEGVFTALTGSYAGSEVTVTAACDSISAELVMTLLKPNIRAIEIRTNGGNTESVSLSRGNSTKLLVTASFEDNTGTDASYNHNLRWEIVESESDSFDADKLRLDDQGQLTADGDLPMEERINLVIEAWVVDDEGEVLRNSAGAEIRDRIKAIINL